MHSSEVGSFTFSPAEQAVIISMLDWYIPGMVEVYLKDSFDSSEARNSFMLTYGLLVGLRSKLDTSTAIDPITGDELVCAHALIEESSGLLRDGTMELLDEDDEPLMEIGHMLKALQSVSSKMPNPYVASP